MGFKSVDELEQFGFHDAVVSKFELKENGIEMRLEAVVVRANNTNNETFTDRYADELLMRLNEGKVVLAFKEGYKYYDANDVLQSETPDEIILETEYETLAKTCEGGHIFVLEKPATLKEKLGRQFPEQFETINSEKQLIFMAVDVEKEDGETTYWLAIAFEKSVLTWERLMNKPEQM